MKVPPKRKGNLFFILRLGLFRTLNESPSEKEGKSGAGGVKALGFEPSMKVPPKRKGNASDPHLTMR